MGVAREEALAAYGHQLAELFGRVREYPRVAALRGWEGEVRLHLRIARKGQLLGVVLARSSGYEVLDRHAVAMIEDLPALPPLPGTLDASEIQIVVPISYRLGRTT
jgi:protein TonB